MLIIFDLDDTLIPTSTIWLEKNFEQLLLKMGCKEDLSLLHQFDREELSSRRAIFRYAKLKGVDAEALFELQISGALEILEKEGDQIFENHVPLALLKFLAKDHTLALVTQGEARLQNGKIKAAGLESIPWVAKVVVPFGSSKGPFYQQIVEKSGFSWNETLICGDHFERDHLPALGMGATLLHLLQGRRAKSNPGRGAIEITDIEQIRDYVRIDQKLLESTI